MKKPYFNKLERHIILEDNSLSASVMKLNLAFNSFFKKLLKPFFNFQDTVFSKLNK